MSTEDVTTSTTRNDENESDIEPANDTDAEGRQSSEAVGLEDSGQFHTYLEERIAIPEGRNDGRYHPDSSIYYYTTVTKWLLAL